MGEHQTETPGGVTDAAWEDWATFRTRTDDPTASGIAAWFEDYVMQPHRDVGRSGHVCPYMAPAVRQNLARLSVYAADPGDAGGMRATLLRGIDLFQAIPCSPRTSLFRTVVVAFPAHADRDGVARLQVLQRSVRYRAAWHGLMVGLFEPDSSQPGVVNRTFHSFRSPIPLIAIRTMVEGDAPFVLRNPLMIPLYLSRFGASGRRRLLRALKQRLKDRFGAAHGTPEAA